MKASLEAPQQVDQAVPVSVIGHVQLAIMHCSSHGQCGGDIVGVEIAKVITLVLCRTVALWQTSPRG